jgi:hypothetical protein
MHRTAATSLQVSAIAAFLLAGQSARGQATPMDELVLYGIDSDTNEMMRYVFSTDTFTPIGVVMDAGGQIIEHPESLAYVPTGPEKGFYTATTRYGPGPRRNRLARFDGLSLVATLYPHVFATTGVRGLVPEQDPVTMQWSLLGVAHNNFNPRYVRISLQPGTEGFESVICPLPNPASFLPAPAGPEEYEDMAAHADPAKLWLLTNEKLVEFTKPTAVAPLGSFRVAGNHPPHRRTEALGIAFGDNGPAVTVPGLPAAWTDQGAVFTFSDNLNVLLVYARDPNPAPLGTFVSTTFPNSFTTVDCEGIVIFTKRNDPFGNIVVDAHD